MPAPISSMLDRRRSFDLATPIERFCAMAAVSTVARSLALGIVGGLAFLGRPAAAQQFSADLVATDIAGRPTGTTGKLYVTNGAVRIETSDLPGSLFLVSGNAGTAYLGQAGPANLHGCEAIEPPDPDPRSGRPQRPV
jgi:hypothetical protein